MTKISDTFKESPGILKTDVKGQARLSRFEQAELALRNGDITLSEALLDQERDGDEVSDYSIAKASVLMIAQRTAMRAGIASLANDLPKAVSFYEEAARACAHFDPDTSRHYSEKAAQMKTLALNGASKPSP